MMQTKCRRQKIQIGRRVIEHTRKQTGAPIKLPDGRDANCAGMFFQQIERRYHRGKDTRKKKCHFPEWRESKFVFLQRRTIRRPVCDRSHQKHRTGHQRHDRMFITQRLQPIRFLRQHQSDDDRQPNKIWRTGQFEPVGNCRFRPVMPPVDDEK